MNVLIIEDNKDVAANISEYLEDQGHEIDAAMDGITGLHLAVVNDYDVIVLDLTLPGMDGLEVCRKLRQEAGKATPILMLTARDTLENKLVGFEVGADDYVVKPFSLRELHARLLVLGRRNQPPGRVLAVADLVLDLNTMEARRAGRKLALSAFQTKILECLLKQSPNVVKKQKLEQALWGETVPDSDALRTHIHILRNIIDKPFAKPLLHTVRGIGYRIVDPNAL